MSEHDELPRSPLLLNRHDSMLLVVDIQTKLIEFIQHHRKIVWNSRRLLDAAKLFSVRVAATEQYPQGLGGTVPELASAFDSVSAKTRFSCGECSTLFSELLRDGIRQIVVVGIESHVCVQQTVLDLQSAGFEIYVVVDAIGARYDLDHKTAVRRMEMSGAYLTTAESVMFEWCESSKDPHFKSLSQLIREPSPGG